MLPKSVFWACFFLTFFTTAVNAEPFTYYPPGSIKKETGAARLSTGSADTTVYVPDMLFPFQDAPAFANSQVYNIKGGDQCPPAGATNYSYPWQDDFCEERSDRFHKAGLCPSGWAHQGQDIRPATCTSAKHVVVAVEDGEIMKKRRGTVVVYSSKSDRYYEYLHMYWPKKTDGKEKNITPSIGSRVVRGQPLGFVSNFQGSIEKPSGYTTIHLHFGILQRVMDKDGKVVDDDDGYAYIPPYPSLVKAYERKIGEIGTELDTPVICKAGSKRCETGFLLPVTDKNKNPDPRHAGTIVCNEDGTKETIEWCTGNTCGTSTSCEKSSTSPPPDFAMPTTPQDLSVSSPPDLSATPPDLSSTCDPRACLCGCNGALCRNQVCSPGSAYCTTVTTLIECSSDGCSSLTKSCGYGCAGNRCNDPPGTVDMSVPPSVDMSVPPPKTEVCNGIDDDGNGIIDDPATCWQWITRFKDPITQARCYGVGSVPPFACSSYDREFVLFAVPTTLWSDGSNSLWVQCSRGIDHVLTAYGSTEYGALTTLGWNCSLQLGYFFNLNQGPRLPKKTPFTYTCPLYRQRFSTSGSQSHFYTPFSESVASATCESPARAEVVAVNGCGVPPGC